MGLIGIFCLVAIYSIHVTWANNGNNEWYADPNSGIQNIINSTSFGDTVFIKKGYYKEETIYLKEGVSLIGQPEDFGSIVISGDPNGAVIWANSHILIQNLVIQDGYVGINCPPGSATDLIIDHNLFINNKNGIFVFSDNVSITNNTIAYNEERGILFFINPNGPFCNVDENIIAFNGANGGIEFVQKDTLYSELPTFLELNKISINYCDVFDKIFQTWLDCYNDLKAQIPIPSLKPLGIGNFSADPYFVDPNAGDYHLLSYSPCIDQGDPNDVTISEPLPNGGRKNIGFYGDTSQAAVSIDSDNDGPEDFYEGSGDMDGDGLRDWLDGDTAVIHLPWDRERIKLNLENLRYDSNTQIIEFKNARTLPFSQIPDDPPEGVIPFGAIQFKLIGLNERAEIAIRLSLPANFGAIGASRYMALNPDNIWISIPFETDPNSNEIILTLKDDQIGDKDRVANEIDHLGTIVIPLSDTWNPSEGCFLNLIDPLESHYRDTKHFYKFDCILKTFILSLIFLFLLLCFELISPLELSRIFLTQNLNRFYKKLRERHPFLILFILFCLLLKTSFVCAEEFVDMQMNSSPSPVGSGARALGIGGAFIAIADDATAASWNPAALLNIKRPEISIVGSYFSGRRTYNTSSIKGEINDLSGDIIHLNYFSIVYPFFLFKRNTVFSINYQHLYEFTQNSFSRLKYLEEELNLDILKTSYKRQKGSLNTLSPAFAFQLAPFLYLGFTANFWFEDALDNHWENLNIVQGEGVTSNGEVKTYAKLYERYDFSGFNTHIGFLYRPNRRFRIGGVIKTPFKADIKHEYYFLSITEYPMEPSLNDYNFDSDTENLSLEMPISYGLGISIHFSDAYLMAFDIYQTHWEDYLLFYPSGTKTSPINNKSNDKADIKTTTQIRIGIEYLVLHKNRTIPIRTGLFYDPEPASGKVDDFYGVSVGTGVVSTDFSFDIAYQYRFGKKHNARYIQGKDIPSDTKQHYLYTSMIFYF